mgnify:CR=1 FL=1
MAIPIKHIPVLKSRVAKNFDRKANETFKHKRHSVDFSKQVKEAERILKKSQMK